MNHQHGTGSSVTPAHTPHTHSEDNVKPHTDPVCGMKAGDKISHDHAGQYFYFCSEHCKTKFKASPEKYLTPASERAEIPVIAGASYTCPMHPEIVQDHPGTCPKCGMALEPIMPTAEDEKIPSSATFLAGFGGRCR